MADWIVYANRNDRPTNADIRLLVLDEHPFVKVDDDLDIRTSEHLPDNALYVFAADLLTPKFATHSDTEEGSA